MTARELRCAGAAAGMALLLGASLASAQTVFDGNVLYDNRPNQIRTGEAPVGACATTSLDVATVRYAHNQYGINDAVGTNPQLGSPYFTGGTNPTYLNWVPAATSPALGAVGFKVVALPNDGWFAQTCYSGALPPAPEDDWTTGNWAYFNRNGAGRLDINYAKPIVTLEGTYPGGYHCGTDSLYFLLGFVRIPSGATITIDAGAVLLGSSDAASFGALIIESGGRIDAQGTRDNPIIMTSDVLPGSQGKGQWGGLWLLGKALANCVANDDSCTWFGAQCLSEGGSIGAFGGNDDADNSGIVRYTRVEYSGKPVSLDNELNSFTFDAVGTGTVLEYLWAIDGDDDGFEWFGGAARLRNAVSLFMNDDNCDWQMGWRGKCQFFVSVADNAFAGCDNGIEADNNEFNFDAECPLAGVNGRSNPVVANLTLVGDPRVGLAGGAGGEGIQLRRGTQGTILNSVIMGFKDRGYDIDDDASFIAACNGGFLPAAIHPCTGVDVEPRDARDGLFFAGAFPNPVQREGQFHFSLPVVGRVTLRLYNVAGQAVRTLVDGELASGPHRVRFVRSGLSSGVYYAALRMGGESVGRSVVLVQ